MNPAGMAVAGTGQGWHDGHGAVMAHTRNGAGAAAGGAPAQGGPALRTEGLSKAFRGVSALADVTLTVPRARVTGIIGPNGAGKSTLFNLITGIAAPDRGRVLLGGTDVTGWPAHRIAASGLARTFQIARELGRLSVLENLLLAAPGQPGEAAWRALLCPGATRRAESQRLEQARELLVRVQLWRLADEPAASLSGGQKKLLELARALMTGARVLLLDEPAAGVNPLLMEQLAGFISDLRGEGLTVVIVEHDMELVASLCDTVCVLAAGQLIAQGPFAEVTGDPRVAEAYLGQQP